MDVSTFILCDLVDCLIGLVRLMKVSLCAPHSANQSPNQSPNQSINQSTNQPINQPTTDWQAMAYSVFHGHLDWDLARQYEGDYLSMGEVAGAWNQQRALLFA